MDGSSGCTLCDPTHPAHTLTGVIRGSDRAGLASQDRSGTPQQIRGKTGKDGYRGRKKRVEVEMWCRDENYCWIKQLFDWRSWLTVSWQNIKDWPWILQSNGLTLLLSTHTHTHHREKRGSFSVRVGGGGGNEHTVTYGKLEWGESNFKVRQMQGQLPLNTFSGHQSICPRAKIVAACISPDPSSAPPVQTDPAPARRRTERGDVGKYGGKWKLSLVSFAGAGRWIYIGFSGKLHQGHVECSLVCINARHPEL